LVVKFYAVANISQIYCRGILIWATLYNKNQGGPVYASPCRTTEFLPS